jgi:hypothetical protein
MPAIHLFCDGQEYTENTWKTLKQWKCGWKWHLGCWSDVWRLSRYPSSNGERHDTFRRACKEWETMWPHRTEWHLSGTRLEGKRKPTKARRQNDRCTRRDSKRTPPKCKQQAVRSE